MELNGRWFPQIVDRDSGNLYPIYILHSLVLIFDPKGGGGLGGGGVKKLFFSHFMFSLSFMLFQTFLQKHFSFRKKKSGVKKNQFFF